jgi:protoporphyrinogen oxidase
MGDEFRPGTRKTQYLLWERRLNYPLELGDLLRKVSPFVSIACMADYFWTTLKGKFITLPEDNFESWVVKRFGRKLYDIFFGQYTAKIWGIPPSTLSRDWAAQRISIINLWDAIRQLIFKPKEDPRTYTRTYYYCDHGIGQISERMTERISANGGNVRMSCPTTSVSLKDGRVQSVTAEENGNTVEFACDTLINTIPITDLVKMITPKAPAEVLHAAEKLRYRALVFLFMKLDQEKVSDNDALYVPEPQYTFFRIEQYKFWSMKMVPSPDKTSLCLEISCFKNDDVWNSSDETLFRQSVEGLKKAGLISDERVISDYFAVRRDFVYPVFEIGYEQYAQCLRDYVDSIPNLISYGRQGYYQYIHMHHVIAKGFQAADHILRGSDKAEIQRVGTEEEYFG